MRCGRPRPPCGSSAGRPEGTRGAPLGAAATLAASTGSPLTRSAGDSMLSWVSAPDTTAHRPGGHADGRSPADPLHRRRLARQAPLLVHPAEALPDPALST